MPEEIDEMPIEMKVKLKLFLVDWERKLVGVPKDPRLTDDLLDSLVKSLVNLLLALDQKELIVQVVGTPYKKEGEDNSCLH